MKAQGYTPDFTEQELVTTGLLFNVGVLGLPQQPLYMQVFDKWHVDRGIFYQYNNDIPYMKPIDRALYIIQLYNIKLTANQTLGIRLAYGPYQESNSSYFSMLQGSIKTKRSIQYVIYASNMLNSLIWSYRDAQKYESIQV